MEENTSSVQRFLRSELSFYGTIIAAVFAITGLYFGMQSGIKDVGNSLNLLSQRVEFSTGTFNDVAAKVSALDLRVSALETAHALLAAQLSNLK